MPGVFGALQDGGVCRGRRGVETRVGSSAALAPLQARLVGAGRCEGSPRLPATFVEGEAVPLSLALRLSVQAPANQRWAVVGCVNSGGCLCPWLRFPHPSGPGKWAAAAVRVLLASPWSAVIGAGCLRVPGRFQTTPLFLLSARRHMSGFLLGIGVTGSGQASSWGREISRTGSTLQHLTQSTLFWIGVSLVADSSPARYHFN